jgi:hypothetical protein
VNGAEERSQQGAGAGPLAGAGHLILETKGYDELAEVKRQVAERFVAASNAEGSFGHWAYAVARKPADVRTILDRA